ncbi:hypothetical protein HELRODRAFT_112842 [Helobdella robusta]|uniref:BAR domain-containing protein n=1 Tax=Helobdella robusta TaxID=6412 RepID=T1EFM5_HELRO|nr:hypothetical protein HELRODRAFT_112842 [Helobdella robusta]ESO00997.1 hypothetical protein HELRODRAFT_112842 [Helobdella robusta]
MNFAKLTSGAGTLINKARQMTSETLGYAEVTEYDPNLVALITKADKIKVWTERIIKEAEAFLQPNQAARVEDYLSEKLQAQKSNRPTEYESFAQVLLEASIDLGDTTPYGATLNKFGAAQTKIAEEFKNFTQKAREDFVKPMKNFLDVNMAYALKEKKNLEDLRLKLDIVKSKMKKLTSSGKEPDPNDLAKVEDELKVAQTAFDEQSAATTQVMENLASLQADHIIYVKAFVTSQRKFYDDCSAALKNLDQD